jgi:hypothetical protein
MGTYITTVDLLLVNPSTKVFDPNEVMNWS